MFIMIIVYYSTMIIVGMLIKCVWRLCLCGILKEMIYCVLD